MGKKKRRNAPDTAALEAAPQDAGTGAGAVRQPSTAAKALGGLVMSLLVLGLIELVLRIAGFSHKPREHLLWKPTVAGFQGTFEFYIQTEFAPPGYVWLSQPNTPYTDSYGFRKPGIGPAKQNGVIRVAFLGGSTTQGGYRPYPWRAIDILNAAAGSNRFEQLNAACSSYSSHQSRIVLDRLVLPLQPDAVVLYDGWNEFYAKEDGYTDKSKDAYMNAAAGGGLAWLAGLKQLRLAQFIGRLAEKVDLSWPKPRVTPEDFELNLNAMIDRCRASNARPFVLSRSNSQRRELASLSPEMITYFSRRFGSADQTNIYNRLHETCLRIQSNACGNGQAGYIDGNARIAFEQQRLARGEIGPKIEIYRQDAIHLFEIGDQMLAEEVARGLAPLAGLGEAVERHLASAAYAESCAAAMLEDLVAREALYYVRMARERGGASERLAGIEREAESLIAFQDRFVSGRWGGSEQDFTRALQDLGWCLSVRPSDTGVALQVIRRCLYMGRGDGAAEILARYRPPNPQDAQLIFGTARHYGILPAR